MKNWITKIFSKEEKPHQVEVEKTETEKVEEETQKLYEKHKVVSVSDGFLSEIKNDQENFMNGLIGKDKN